MVLPVMHDPVGGFLGANKTMTNSDMKMGGGGIIGGRWVRNRNPPTGFLYRYRYTIPLTIIMVVITLLLIIITLTGITTASWWDTDWDHYKRINITDGNNSYVIPINVTYSSGGDVNCSSGCNSNFSDIRFLDGDNSTVLDHWIEYTNDGNFSLFWVKLPSDVETDQHILMYYGNSMATDTSNGTAVFTYFEDFTGSNGADPTGWTDTGGYWEINSNSYRMNSGEIDMGQAYVTVSSITDCRIIAKMRTDVSNGYTAVIARRQAGVGQQDCYWFAQRYHLTPASNMVVGYFYNGGNTNLGSDASNQVFQSTWHRTRTYLYNNTWDMYHDDVHYMVNVSLGGHISSPGSVGVTGWNNGYRWVDDFAVTGLIETEPAIGTVSGERSPVVPGGDCPHAMLVHPINNSVVEDTNVVLTVYVYDDDDSIWELNVTFYDSDDTIIDFLVTATERDVSTVWLNLTPGDTYEWYAYVDNGTGNMTTGMFMFTVTGTPLFGFAYGIIIFLVFFALNIIIIEKKNTLPWYLLLFITGGILIRQLSLVDLTQDSIEFYIIIIVVVLMMYYLLRGVFLVFDRGSGGKK